MWLKLNEKYAVCIERGSVLPIKEIPKTSSVVDIVKRNKLVVNKNTFISITEEICYGGLYSIYLNISNPNGSISYSLNRKPKVLEFYEGYYKNYIFHFLILDFDYALVFYKGDLLFFIYDEFISSNFPMERGIEYNFSNTRFIKVFNAKMFLLLNIPNN